MAILRGPRENERQPPQVFGSEPESSLMVREGIDVDGCTEESTVAETSPLEVARFGDLGLCVIDMWPASHSSYAGFVVRQVFCRLRRGFPSIQ